MFDLRRRQLAAKRYKARRETGRGVVEVAPEPMTEEPIVPAPEPRVEQQIGPKPAAHDLPQDRRDLLQRTIERLSEEGREYFGPRFDEARKQAGKDSEEMLDPNDVPLETREAIAALEGELEDEIAAINDTATRTRVQIAEKGLRGLEGVLYFVKNGVPEMVKTVGEELDLDTWAKAYSAVLEIVPTVSFWYAVTGKRVRFQEGQGVLKRPYLEDIDKIDRLLYLAGSVFFLGHVYSGIRHSLLKRGFWNALQKHGMWEAGRRMLPELSRLVGPTVARAQDYAIRKLTEDRRGNLKMTKKSEE